MIEYEKRGWEILSSNSRSDNNFLINLLKNLSNAKTVVSTDISSIFFYAMYINKKVFLVRKDKDKQRLNLHIYKNKLLEYTNEFIN